MVDFEGEPGEMSSAKRHDISIMSFQSKSYGTVMSLSDWVDYTNKALEKEQRECLDDYVIAGESVKRKVLVSELD